MQPTVAQYTRRWLEVVRATRAQATWRCYSWIMRGYVVPQWGTLVLRDLSRSRAIDIVLAASPLISRGSLCLLVAVLRSMLGAALDEGVVNSNPATGLVRRLRLRSASEAQQRAMTREDLSRFLLVAESNPAPWPLLWHLLAGAGLRVGEALALRVVDVDLVGRVIRVGSASAKNGHARWVEIPEELARRLGTHASRRKEGLLIVNRGGGPLKARWVRRRFKHVAKEAGLARRMSPHTLRHTYASVLVSAGAPLEWVRRQLGHSSIRLTADLYGRHLPMTGRRFLKALDKV